jgi:hypothetical protein
VRIPLLAGLAGLFGASASFTDLGAASAAVAAADLPVLVAGSEWIADVQVLETQPVLLPDGRIETRYTVATLAPLKGAISAIAEFRMPGGEVAGRGLVLPGLPRLRAGQRVLLFLTTPTAARGWRVPVGLGAGAFEVLADPAAGATQLIGMGSHADTAPQDHDAFVAAILAEVARQAPR